MKTTELFEGQNPLVGYLDPYALAGLLPDLTNARDFANAIGKLRLGQGGNLTLQEKMQLALGFVSLIGAAPAQKTAALRQMMMIQTGQPAPAVAPQQTQQTPGQTQPQGQPSNT